jgi:hypothetical protein
VVNLDIGDILDDWPYDHGQVSARRIRGADGREKIQLRLDLGLLQMEVEGRPDGTRPNGYPSLLDYHEAMVARYRDEHSGSDLGYELDERECELLRAESVMYYHRYLAQFILENYAAVEADAQRNLRLMDFCNRYAEEESDRYILEQHRPYVLMMCARARARLALRQNRPKAALAAVRRAMKQIREFFDDFGQLPLASRSSEMAILRGMAKEIESMIPVDPIRRLRKQLAKAVRDERYEEAASLRDQIDRLSSRRRDK